MSTNKTNRTLQTFLEEISPACSAYAYPYLTYLLHNGTGGISLVAANLILDPARGPMEPVEITTGSFFGFKGTLDRLDLSISDFLDQILSSRLPALSKDWELSKVVGSEPRFSKNNDIANITQFQQQKVIAIAGEYLSSKYVHDQDDDWEMRASPTPYSNVDDLKSSLGLLHQSAQFNATALPPTLIANGSLIEDDRIKVEIVQSPKIPKQKTKLGIIVRSKEQVEVRRQLMPSEIKWHKNPDNDFVESGIVDIPANGALSAHCLVTHDETCYHHWWVFDPNKFHNPLRAICEMLDPNLKDVAKSLNQKAEQGNSGKQEAAVCTLLWAMGFAPLHAGSQPNAPDVIAMSRDGNFLVVECTLSHLQNKSNKPQRLLDRAAELRMALESAEVGFRSVVPVIITAKPRVDVEKDAAECEGRGIVVITSDDVQTLIDRTLNQLDSATLFDELQSTMKNNVRAHARRQRE